MSSRASLMGERTPLLNPKEMTESTAAKKDRWRSIKLVYLVNFLNGMGFSVVLSTLWQLLERNGGSKSFLGYLVSSFSFAQVIGAPFWGYWANHFSYKILFQLTIMLKIIGYGMYVISDAVTGQRDVYMLESRFLVGLGAANIALCQAYVSLSTTMEERTQGMAFIAATNGLGLVVGPLLGMSFGKMKPGVMVGDVILDYLTMPGVLCVVLELANFLLVMLMFKDRRLSQNVVSAGSANNADTVSIQSDNSVNNQSRFKRDKMAMATCIALNFGIMVVISVLETIGTPFTMDEFGWDAQQADVDNGIISGLFGFLGFVGFVLAKPISVKLSERKTLMLGLFMTILGMLLLQPMFGGPPKQWKPDDDDDDSTRKGCRDDWCGDMPGIKMGQYAGCIVLIGLGFPLANVMTFSLFSKILGPGPQGVMIGWLQAAGSLARAIGPLYFSVLYAKYGPRLTFGVGAGLVVLQTVWVIAVYKRLVPHKAYQLADSTGPTSSASKGGRRSVLTEH